MLKYYRVYSVTLMEVNWQSLPIKRQKILKYLETNTHVNNSYVRKEITGNLENISNWQIMKTYHIKMGQRRNHREVRNTLKSKI